MGMLDISVTDGGSGPVLALAGEADLTTLPQLASALRAQMGASPRLVTVDASRLRFADSATIAALIAAARTLRDRGGQLELLQPQPAVARTLELTGADQFLAVRGEPAAGPGPAREPGPDQDGPELPALRVLLASAGGDTVLRLAGEIDITTASIAADAAERCLRGRPARMTVDLDEVTFCDCAGGWVLQHAQQQATAAGTSFRLTGLTAPVRRVLTLMQATRLLRATCNPAGPGDDPGASPAAGHQAAAADGPPAARRPAARPGRDTRAAPDAIPLASPPDAVSAARRQLNQHYARGVERLLWELDKQPIPDEEAIRRAITAIGHGEAAEQQDRTHPTRREEGS